MKTETQSVCAVDVKLMKMRERNLNCVSPAVRDVFGSLLIKYKEACISHIASYLKDTKCTSWMEETRQSKSYGTRIANGVESYNVMCCIDHNTHSGISIDFFSLHFWLKQFYTKRFSGLKFFARLNCELLFRPISVIIFTVMWFVECVWFYNNI